MPSCLSLEIKRPSCAPSKKGKSKKKLSLIKVSLNLITHLSKHSCTRNSYRKLYTLVKTDRLADKHYQRVSNFAKEMLVNPTELDVHKLKNEFTDEIRDNPVR